MKYQKVLDLVEKFAKLSEEEVQSSPANVEFQAQRERLAKFCEEFHKIRGIFSELGGEIKTLQMRHFDPKMERLLYKVYQDIVDIYKTIDPNQPYIAAEKLVQFVLERPNGPIIDNLNFLAKHHLKTTNVDFGAGKSLRHPRMRSLDSLKTFAKHLKDFMAKYPVIKSPGPTAAPFANLKENMEIVPDFSAGREDVTKPGVPLAKK